MDTHSDARCCRVRYSSSQRLRRARRVCRRCVMRRLAFVVVAWCYQHAASSYRHVKGACTGVVWVRWVWGGCTRVSGREGESGHAPGSPRLLSSSSRHRGVVLLARRVVLSVCLAAWSRSDVWWVRKREGEKGGHPHRRLMLSSVVVVSSRCRRRVVFACVVVRVAWRRGLG